MSSSRLFSRAVFALTACVALMFGGGIGHAQTDYEITLNSQEGRGHFLSVEDSQDVFAYSRGVSKRERFLLTDLNGGMLMSGDSVTLRSFQGLYLCNDLKNGELLFANREIPGQWETFRIYSVSGPLILGNAKIFNGSDVSLRSVVSGNWVCANYQYRYGRVSVDRPNRNLWETFKIQYGYNRKAAKDYSLKYSGTTWDEFIEKKEGIESYDNSLYNQNYLSFRSDCTNFGSQTLWAGGLMPDWGSFTDPNMWFYEGPDENQQSVSWIRADALANYLEVSGKGRAVTSSELEIGDLVFADWYKKDWLGKDVNGQDGKFDHVMTVTGRNGSDPLLTYHSPNRMNRSLNYLKTSTALGKIASFRYVKLDTGFSVPSNPDVNYQVHAARLGWLPWMMDGDIAGTTGQNRQLESVRISSPGRDISYQAHVAEVGWMPVVSNGTIAGTTGRNLRLEALRIWSGRGHVTYFVHVQNVGWMGPFRDGEIAGAPGRGLRVEAIKVRVTE